MLLMQGAVRVCFLSTHQQSHADLNKMPLPATATKEIQVQFLLSSSRQVYDNGCVYSPEVLDITEAALHARFLEGVRNIASVCLEIGYPTLASIPHTIINTITHCMFAK
ncbi:hypothetical protein DPEC_G00004640 [Dallia pectoralis]|uniref:Uncharacterized protein n=1 Tax=Dallia pectoralis TaxID=75939 RepID=A0ACC2HK33_DALPE|nr:hypothetical protein DPEC_G00004640 [Dallia pectoralis]